MRTLLVDVPLIIAVLCVWLGCAGFLRLRDPLDRLHCVAFVNVTTSLALALTGFAAEGVSGRSLKILVIATLMLIGGAAGTHLTGRAVLRRRTT